MADVKVIYGSSTGNTENAAQQLAGAFGTVAVNIAKAAAEDFDAPLLILGTSTWGLGESGGIDADFQFRTELADLVGILFEKFLDMSKD